MIELYSSSGNVLISIPRFFMNCSNAYLPPSVARYSYKLLPKTYLSFSIPTPFTSNAPSGPIYVSFTSPNMRSTNWLVSSNGLIVAVGYWLTFPFASTAEKLLTPSHYIFRAACSGVIFPFATRDYNVLLYTSAASFCCFN
jgi:hypothetical protein